MDVTPTYRKCSSENGRASWKIAFGVIFGLAGFGCTPNTTDRDIRFISGAETLRLVEKARSGESQAVVLIDPRPKTEYEAGHIEGAWHMTLPMVPVQRAPEARLNSFDTIIVYGNNPGAPTAKGMCKRLIANDYSPDIYWFAGGLEEWRAQNGPVAEGPDTRTIGPK